MPKRYTIDVERYPEQFTVVAESIEEAKEKAKELFYSKNNNGSVYAINLVETEDLNENEPFQYHKMARYVDCKGLGADYCNKCGYTK